MCSICFQKFAKHACVKPKNKVIRIKRERNPVVKSEMDIDESPFDSSTVYCGPKDITEEQKKQILSKLPANLGRRNIRKYLLSNLLKFSISSNGEIAMLPFYP
jgi:hypothetical protein